MSCHRLEHLVEFLLCGVLGIGLRLLDADAGEARGVESAEVRIVEVAGEKA